MAANSNIEWCDHTLNLWEGCTKLSPACDGCYAEAERAKRFKTVKWGNHPRRRMSPATRNQCHKWQRNAAKFYEEHGRKQRVFVNSLSDIFDNKVPQEWREEHYQQAKDCPDLIFIWLTKRPQNVKKFSPDDWGNGYKNVWLGTTVENQQEADRRIPILLDTPAKLRFLSCEPLLGPVDFYKTGDAMPMNCHPWRNGPILQGIHWIICGGESGPGARPMHPDWARSLREQCQQAGVPFLFKQWGEWECEIDRDNDDQDWRKNYSTNNPKKSIINIEGGQGFHGDRVCLMNRVGKKRAGRLLGGVEHNGFPEVAL